MGLFKKKLSSKAKYLQSVRLFQDLDESQLEVLAQYADEVPMPSGSLLAKQGSHGQEFMFILDGTAVVERDGKVMRQLAAGDYFGEVSLIDGGLRTATVKATSDVNLLVIEMRAFNHVLDEIPQLARNMLKTLCSYLRKTDALD